MGDGFIDQEEGGTVDVGFERGNFSCAPFVDGEAVGVEEKE